MKYIALLRGINVGGNHKVEMTKLKKIFETLGYTNVSSYINSGNIIFETNKKKNLVYKELGDSFKKAFRFDIPTLIKTQKEISEVAKAIPKGWENNDQQKTDVAYLFPEIDTKKMVDSLPINKDFSSIRYVKGAVIWNVERKNYNKSRLNKVIGSTLYQYMTVRNVNTARFLGKS